MLQKQKTRQGDGDEEQESIWINLKNADGTKVRVKVKEGIRTKEFLAGLKHSYVKGLAYKLNNVLLEVDKETGELLEDPVLEQEATLVIQQTFTGGK